MSKGFAGTVFLTTDDCRASVEELKARGVEFSEDAEERPYGIDAGFRDPSGQLDPADRGEAAGRSLSRRGSAAARPFGLPGQGRVDRSSFGTGSAISSRINPIWFRT